MSEVDRKFFANNLLSNEDLGSFDPVFNFTSQILLFYPGRFVQLVVLCF